MNATLLDLIFPNRCLHCNQIIPGTEVVCGNCYSQIYFTHFQFQENNRLKEQCKLLFPVENAFALMHFEKEGLTQKILHQLKYASREKIGKIIASWIIQNIEFGDEKPDLLVTIPLHPKKMKKRGYNQLHLFTETLSKHYGIPFDHEVLQRTHYHKAQANRSRKERLISEKKFTLQKDISNKHILMIDDVFTTGNTMSDAAWEILKNPGNKISVLVMAVD